MSVCDFTDLPAVTCAHCTGATLDDPKPIRYEGSDREARWAGNCACCGERFPEGTAIVCADVQGDGSDEWCIYSHTRANT